jgi:hypothetical protein
MDPMPFRFALAALVILAATACDADPPVPAGRVRSTYGYSLQPPSGDGWTEHFGKNETTWGKKTDASRVTFVAGTDEHRTAAPLATDDALLAYARKMTAVAGDDGSGRYSGLTENHAIAPDQPTCVDYRIASLDHGAKNLGGHDALPMLTRGRFCVHPDDRTAAVNVYYSIRHVPGFEIGALEAEGEALLRSLEFDRRE